MRRFVGRLGGVDANRSIEEGGGEDVGVSWAPVDLESPVGSGRELAKGFGRVRSPAEGAVVLATG